MCVCVSINKHIEVHETGCGRHGARSSHALFSLDVCLRVWSECLCMADDARCFYFRRFLTHFLAKLNKILCEDESLQWPMGTCKTNMETQRRSDTLSVHEAAS